MTFKCEEMKPKFAPAMNIMFLIQNQQHLREILENVPEQYEDIREDIVGAIKSCQRAMNKLDKVKEVKYTD